MMKYIAQEYAPAGARWVILRTDDGEEIARFRTDRFAGLAAWQNAKEGIARAGGSVFLSRLDGTGGYVIGSVDQIDTHRPEPGTSTGTPK
jgi:hypothetical protein